MLKSYLVQTDEQNAKCHGGNIALAEVNQVFYDLFLKASESENKFFKILETKKLATVQIRAIIAVYNKIVQTDIPSKIDYQ